MRTRNAPDRQQSHTVRFYGDDGALCRIVAAFLSEGLAADDPAVVIAVPAHGDEIVRCLRASSFDVDRLRAAGTLLILDAEEMLGTFMRDGVPDAAAFEEHVGGLLDRLRAGKPGATVRAYGEMVDWLWKHGAAAAAVRLEVLWNDLASTHGSLLCGYSMGNFYKHGAHEAQVAV
jgi:hypothetical protein